MKPIWISILALILELQISGHVMAGPQRLGKITLPAPNTNQIHADDFKSQMSHLHDARSSADKAAEIAGDDINEAERYNEEYGNISMSLPILAKLTSQDFAFDLRRGATNYYSDAKSQVQAAAASYQQAIQSLSINAQAQVDPAMTAAYASQLGEYFSSLQRFQTKQNLTDLAVQQQFQASIAVATNAQQRAAALAAYAQLYGAGTNPPVYPTDDPSNTNLPPLASAVAGRPNVTNVLSNQQFSPFQGLLGQLSNPPQPTLSDRASLLQAAGDNATESIFRHFMGNTNLANDGAEDNLYFGFSTVSVSPGWRTQKGWAAEVMMTAEISYVPARRAVYKAVYDVLNAPNGNKLLADKLAIEYGANVTTKPPGISTNSVQQIVADAIDQIRAKLSEKLAASIVLNRFVNETNSNIQKQFISSDPAAFMQWSNFVESALGFSKANAEAINQIQSELEPQASLLAPFDLIQFLRSGQLQKPFIIISNSSYFRAITSSSPKLFEASTNLLDKKYALSYAQNQFGKRMHPSNNASTQERIERYLSATTSDERIEVIRSHDWHNDSEFEIPIELVEAATSAVKAFDYVTHQIDTIVSTVTNSSPFVLIEFLNATNLVKKKQLIVSDPKAFIEISNSTNLVNAATNSIIVNGDPVAIIQKQIASITNASPFLEFNAFFAAHSQEKQKRVISTYSEFFKTNTSKDEVDIVLDANKAAVNAKIQSDLTNNVSLSTYELLAIDSLDNLQLVSAPVTIISPLIDADAQDLSESTRSQTEFALALSFALRYAGLNSQANAFEQFVKNQLLDVRTRSQSIAVNAFSATDGRFGFQIGPRLKALGEPAVKSRGPDEILDRQSFPALLILHLGAVDLAPKLRLYPSTNVIIGSPESLAEFLNAPTNHLQVIEPSIKFTEIRRWTPMKHFYSKDGWLFSIFQPREFLNPPLTERRRLEAVNHLNEARNIITMRTNDVVLKVRNAMLKRIENLESQLAGGDGTVVLDATDIVPRSNPSTNKPNVLAITSTTPTQIIVVTNSSPIQQIVFLGTGLDQINTNSPAVNVTVLPAIMTNYVTVTGLERVGQALLLSLTIDFSRFQADVGSKTLIFKFSTIAATNATPANINYVLSMPLTLYHAEKVSNQSATFSFSNSGTNAAGGFTYSLTGPSTNTSDVNSTLVLAGQLIKSDLEKNKPDPLASSNTLLNISIKPGILDTNGQIRIRL